MVGCADGRVRCTTLVLGLWLDVQVNMLATPGRRRASRFWYMGDSRAPKVASLGSWDMYSLVLRGRVMGLQCVTLLILKYLHNVSYRVSGMCHSSSCSSC